MSDTIPNLKTLEIVTKSRLGDTIRTRTIVESDGSLHEHIELSAAHIELEINNERMPARKPAYINLNRSAEEVLGFVGAKRK